MQLGAPPNLQGFSFKFFEDVWPNKFLSLFVDFSSAGDLGLFGVEAADAAGGGVGGRARHSASSGGCHGERIDDDDDHDEHGDAEDERNEPSGTASGLEYGNNVYFGCFETQKTCSFCFLLVEFAQKSFAI